MADMEVAMVADMVTDMEVDMLADTVGGGRNTFGFPYCQCL